MKVTLRDFFSAVEQFMKLSEPRLHEAGMPPLARA